VSMKVRIKVSFPSSDASFTTNPKKDFLKCYSCKFHVGDLSEKSSFKATATICSFALDLQFSLLFSRFTLIYSYKKHFKVCIMCL